MAIFGLCFLKEVSDASMDFFELFIESALDVGVASGKVTVSSLI